MRFGARSKAAADEVPVRCEPVRAGEDADLRIGPILLVYSSSM